MNYTDAESAVIGAAHERGEIDANAMTPDELHAFASNGGAGTSRSRKAIVQALNAKGYLVTLITWEPKGAHLEMAGQEGGWYVQTTPATTVCGANLQDVLAMIADLPRGDDLFDEREARAQGFPC